MGKHNLERVIDQKQKTEHKRETLEPVVNSAMQHVLGMTIAELSSDITSRIAKNPLWEFAVDASLPFKQAKKRFKQEYLKRLLRITYGNVSEVSKLAGVDRRSIHRIVKDAGINVTMIREEMIKPYEIKQKAIEHIIEDVLENYKSMIHPEKLAQAYEHVDDVSKSIIAQLPEEYPDIKLAEEDFEREYFRKLIIIHPNVTKAARSAGIRYETLLRKLKQLGLR